MENIFVILNVLKDFNKTIELFIDQNYDDSLKNIKCLLMVLGLNLKTKKTFETLNPENNEPWAKVPEASAKDVDKAVRAAQKAFEGEWPQLLPKERGKFLKTIGNQLRENAELLGKIETIDTGKLYRETKKQANYIAEYYDYYAGLADKVEGTVLPIDKPNIHAITTRIPIGVSCCYCSMELTNAFNSNKVSPCSCYGKYSCN